ncbi:MAG TPA: phage holin family protein [Ilumatobacter sp.]|nr:phage holin family protein [Ilumatobacter sp.]
MIETVKTYAKQETVEPLKRAGKYVGYGAAGGLLTGLGIAVLILGLLRFVQSEWSRSAEGRLSWLAYVIALLGTIVLGGLAMWFANRQIKKSIVGKDRA